MDLWCVYLFFLFLPDVICSTNIIQTVWCIARDSIRDHPSRLFLIIKALSHLPSCFFPTVFGVIWPVPPVSQRLSLLHRPVEGSRGRGKFFFLRSRWSYDATWWPVLLPQVWGTKRPPVVYNAFCGLWGVLIKKDLKKKNVFIIKALTHLAPVSTPCQMNHCWMERILHKFHRKALFEELKVKTCKVLKQEVYQLNTW